MMLAHRRRTVRMSSARPLSVSRSSRWRRSRVADARFDHAALDQFVQHAAERLLGDAKQREQLADRQIGLPAR